MLMIRFSDHVNRKLPTVQEYSKLFNDDSIWGVKGVWNIFSRKAQ